MCSKSISFVYAQHMQSLLRGGLDGLLVRIGRRRFFLLLPVWTCSSLVEIQVDDLKPDSIGLAFALYLVVGLGFP